MAGDRRPVARWRSAALLYPRAGTSPGAGPGESPAVTEPAGAPSRSQQPRGRPRARPRARPGARPGRSRLARFPPPRAPKPASLLPLSSDNNAGVTLRAWGFANRASTRDTAPLTCKTKPGARPVKAVRSFLWRRNQIQGGPEASPVTQPVCSDVTGEARSSVSLDSVMFKNLNFPRNSASMYFLAPCLLV